MAVGAVSVGLKATDKEWDALRFTKVSTIDKGGNISWYTIFLPYMMPFSTFLTIQKEFSGCRDPKDNYLFDLAFQSNSKYLVSGDRDVRETEIDKPLNVVSLRTFKEMIAE